MGSPRPFRAIFWSMSKAVVWHTRDCHSTPKVDGWRWERSVLNGIFMQKNSPKNTCRWWKEASKPEKRRSKDLIIAKYLEKVKGLEAEEWRLFLASCSFLSNWLKALLGQVKQSGGKLQGLPRKRADRAYPMPATSRKPSLTKKRVRRKEAHWDVFGNSPIGKQQDASKLSSCAIQPSRPSGTT